MINIKFINATSVQLRTVGSPKQIEYTINGASQGGPLFSCSNNFFSKDDQNYYYFAISGQNVQLSGQITEVTEDYQFFNLFRDQPAIKDASKLALSAPSVKKFSYANMFLDCQNLTAPPTLSATTLDQWCYSSMFGNCYKLATAPALPATTLAKYCYYCMFYNCQSLVTAPYLPARYLADWCYNSMFYNCKNLTSISSNFSYWSPSNATTNWVTNIKTVGVFYNNNINFVEDYIIYGVDNIPQTWTYQISHYATEPITFKSTGNTTVKINLANLSSNTNEGGWTAYTANTALSLSNGDIVSFSGTNSTVAQSFVTTGDGTLEVFGNPHSLMNYSQIKSGCFNSLLKGCGNITDASNLALTSVNAVSQCYQNMFANCSSLVYPPQLPAYQQLGQFGYSHMFSGCSNLIEAPQIPKINSIGVNCCEYMFYGCSSLVTPPPSLQMMNLTDRCYRYMFQLCYALTSVPSLPATGLYTYCYQSMFSNCKSLSSVPANLLPAKVLAQGCYQSMFAGCTSLTAAPNLPATTLVDECYYNMFYNCSGIVEAPNLLANTIAPSCYANMFDGCTSLTAAPSILPAKTLPSACYKYMFNKCTSLSTVPSYLIKGTTLNTESCFGMFSGCSSLKDAPHLLTTNELAQNCYVGMFAGCTSLTSINVDLTTWKWSTYPNHNPFNYWVQNVSTTGVFYKPKALSTELGTSRIPNRWTVIDK